MSSHCDRPLCSCWTVQRCFKHQVLPLVEIKCSEQERIEEAFLLKINDSQSLFVFFFFLLDDAQQRQIYAFMRTRTVHVIKRTDVTTTTRNRKKFFLLPPDSQVSLNLENKTAIISLHIISRSLFISCHGCTKGK